MRTLSKDAVWPFRLVLLLFLSAIPTTHAYAQSLEVAGKAGYLREWELTARVAQSPTSGNKAYLGPLTLRHVGLCTQSGPEVKTGTIRLELSGSSSRITATLIFDGTACSYTGKKQDDYVGFMSCGAKNDVPLQLSLR